MVSFDYKHGRVLTFNGTRYFARESEQIQIGDYGRKNVPILGGYSYLSPEDEFNFSGIRVSRASHLTTSQISEFEQNQSLTASVPIDETTGAEIDLGFTTGNTDAKDVEMSLIVLSVPMGIVQQSINSLSKTKRYAIKQDGRWRAVQAVVVAVAGRVNTSNTSNVSFSMDASGTVEVEGVEVELGVDQGGDWNTTRSATLRLDSDSTVGYRLAEPAKWQRHGSRKKRNYTVTRMRDDNKGFG